MVSIERYRLAHLEGVLELCRAEGWPTLASDPDRAQRALTAPGVVTVVALDGGDEVVGFAQALTDGCTRAYLTTMAVAADRRRPTPAGDRQGARARRARPGGRSLPRSAHRRR